MTNLNPEQAKLLAKVEVELRKFEGNEAVAEEEHKATVLRLQKPLRDAMREARAGGVPVRKMQIMIGTQDYKTIQRYFDIDENGGLTTQVKAGTVVAPKITHAGVTQVEPNLFIVTDIEGRDWEFWTVDFGTVMSVQRSSHTDRGAETRELELTKEVIEAVKAHIPNADLTELEIMEVGN
jgi:hypothetical protein